LSAPAGSDDDARSSLRAQELVTWLAERACAACARCGAPLCAHELLFANALGHKLVPVCAACAAAEAGTEDAHALRAHLRAHFERRSCYRAAWSWADEREPDCPVRHVRPEDATAALARTPVEVPADSWDAGDLGCGDLVLELRARMHGLDAGESLELFARDPGAREDLPAWCRLTGHELVDARPPRFVIRRRPAGAPN
jgi:tRNA 2-thiouridine synthesizing protein A